MIAENKRTDSWKLIEKFFEGNYPEHIERQFHLWLLNGKKGNEKEEALENMWETIPYGDPKQFIGSLNTVRTKLGLPQKSIRLGQRSVALKVAAVVLPFLLIAGGYLMFDRFIQSPTETHLVSQLEAVKGTTVVLPDQSVVEITEGKLTYPADFTGPERIVNLDGSGYFEIASVPDRPFIVESELLTVRVTGTKFMLSTDRGSSTSTLSLVQGSVDVIIPGKEAVSLNEGKELKYSPASGNIIVSELPEQLSDREAFTQGRLVFENSTLEEILAAAARSRGYELQFNKTGRLTKKYNIKFKEGENIDEILGVLNVLTNSSFSYIIENDTIIIE